MKSITLKQMRYFEALARHQHFGHAAEAVAISQPALSMQIKDLEDAMGGALFERGPRAVRLSGFGEAAALRVRSVLRAVEELEEFANAAHGGAVSRLRLGVIPTIAPYLLPHLIGRLTKTYAGIDINVRETLTEKLIQDLLNGRLDTAIVALPVSEPSLQEMPLFEEAFVLIRPGADHDKPVPDVVDLRAQRLLLLEEGHCFRDQALDFCDIRSAAPKDGLDGSSLSTLVQMVAAGLGVTLVPEMAVPVETRAASVAVARFAKPEPTRTIGMIWRKTSPLAEQLADIAGIVQATAGALEGAGRTKTSV